MGLPLAADDGLFAVCSVCVCVLCVCVWGNVCLRVFVKSFHQAKISTIRRMLLCQRVQSTIGLCSGSGREKEREGAPCGTSCALKCSDRALHKFVWLCLCCCVATSMLHNPIKFSLRLCYFKKQQQRKRCLICRAAFIDFFSSHTHTNTSTLCCQFTLFFYAPPRTY